MNTLGIPSWGSYVIFAIITLFMGLMLGLVSLSTSFSQFRWVNVLFMLQA